MKVHSEGLSYVASSDDARFVAPLKRVIGAIVVQRSSFMGTLVVVIAMFSVLAFVPRPWYESTVVLAPASSDVLPGGLSSILGHVGDLASLVGMGKAGNGDDSSAVALLKSRGFVEAYINEKNLMPVLFDEKWDKEHGKWKSTDGSDAPTADDAWRLFDRKIRNVNQDQRTGIITLTISWRDRVAAANWGNDFAARINSQLRDQVIAEADASIHALETELARTEMVEIKSGIYQLIEAQIQRKVMAKSRDEYAFKVIDKAVIADKDNFVSPKRGLLLAVGFMLGLGLGAAAALIRAGRRSSYADER